jgi:hypothetical protein
MPDTAIGLEHFEISASPETLDALSCRLSAARMSTDKADEWDAGLLRATDGERLTLRLRRSVARAHDRHAGLRASSLVGIHLTDLPFWHMFQKPDDLSKDEERYLERVSDGNARTAPAR